MRRLGFEPMPWQRYALDVAYEYDPDSGKLYYREVVEVVPRQAGKTAKVLAVQVHRATTMAKRIGRPQRSIYTAQRHLDARVKLLEDHLPILEASPYAPFVTAQRATASEGIQWSNRSQHHIAAPTWKAGHGGSIDLAQVDEAFALQSDEVEQGLKPAQITRRNAQLYVISAAGDHRSSYLRSKLNVGRELARTGADSGVCYFEWSADGLDLDLDSPATWRAVHPGLGFIIDEDAIAADHRSMKPAEFYRAYLAVWPSRQRPRIITQESWDACADPASACADPVCFAIDVSPDRGMAAVSVSGRRADGLLHVETIRHDVGTGWVVEYVKGLLGRHKRSTLSVDTVGSASSLLPELERHRVPVRLLTTQDVARSMGLLLDKVAQGQLRHRDQAALNVALAGADKRRIGDKWAWARGDGDITPLVSATLALWSLETVVEPRKFKMGLAV